MPSKNVTPIKIYTTPAQKAALEAVARIAGMSVSEYINAVLKTAMGDALPANPFKHGGNRRSDEYEVSGVNS